MPHVLTPNGVKVCMRFRMDNQVVCNVFHVDNGENPTLADLDLIAEQFYDFWSIHLRNQLSNTLTLEAIEVVDISEEGGEGIEYIPPTNPVGLNPNPPLPMNVSVVTKLTTGRTGRSYRGRKYWNGLCSNHRTGTNGITPEFKDFLTTAMNFLITALELISKPLSVLSLVTNGLPRAVGLLTAITAVSTDQVLDSQRRRLPGRGS